MKSFKLLLTKNGTNLDLKIYFSMMVFYNLLYIKHWFYHVCNK